MMKTWFMNKLAKDVDSIIDMINSKLEENAYPCSEEFLFDIKKVRHVIRTRHPEVEAGDIDSYINKMGKICQELDLCPYCVHNYLAETKGVIELCPWGHKLILIDLNRGQTFKFGKHANSKRLENLPSVFPAKILRFDQKSHEVIFRHFGSLMRLEYLHSL